MSDPAPLSKTAKYKKITKPLLERKRRARINRCLDELKDLMVGALEIDDDNLSKLEKADILELTVNHLTKLHRPKDPVLEAKKFQAGFGQCAAEACRFIMSVPDLDSNVSQNLVSHLSRMITDQPLTIQVPERQFSPPTSPSSVLSDRQHYYSDHERSSSDAEDSVYSSDAATKQWAYSSRPYQPRAQQNMPPLAGLLTTVDKLPLTYNDENVNGNLRHSNVTQYFNRVPAEAKDVILQKIRQHIMDKRGNDTGNPETAIAETAEPKYLYKDDAYRSENIAPTQYVQPTANNNNNYTLDLRKVRSPSKTSTDPAHSPKKTLNQLDSKSPPPPPPPPPSVETKDDAASVLPEHCKLPMDYSNLPPKKKRKLIEYQEYKKQEEARRQREAAFLAMKKSCVERPAEDDEAKWRPW